MKRLALLAAVAVGMMAGCGSQELARASLRSSSTPAAKPALRLGAADDLGWSLHRADRAIAASNPSVRSAHVSEQLRD